MNADVAMVDVGGRQTRRVDDLGFETVEGIQSAFDASVSALFEKDFAAGFDAGNAIQPGADPA